MTTKKRRHFSPEQKMGINRSFPGSFTLDVYLLFLLVDLGVPFFLLHVWLFVLPPVLRWRALRRLRGSHRPLYVFYCVLRAWVVAGALVGPMSNSQVTNSNLSNLLSWSGLGLPFKIPVLERQAPVAQWVKWGLAERVPANQKELQGCAGRQTA